MSVITDTYSDFLGTKGKGKCNHCDRTLRCYPFLEWRTYDKSILLCVECCQVMKHGFVADLIQVVAIKEFQDTDDIYRDYTLVRKHKKDLEADGKREAQKYDDAMAGKNK